MSQIMFVSFKATPIFVLAGYALFHFYLFHSFQEHVPRKLKL